MKKRPKQAVDGLPAASGWITSLPKAKKQPGTMPERLAYLWYLSVTFKIDLEYRSKPLDGLRMILGPVCFLQRYGGAATDLKKYRDLDDLIDAASIIEAAERAEAELEKHGWRYNPDKPHKIEAIHKGHRPERFVNRCIRRVHTYLKDSGQLGEPAETRQKIHDFLRPYFPEDFIGPESRGPIHRVIW